MEKEMINMRGVLLCGGQGTRLKPLTAANNKHLLRIGRYPMLEYPLRKMIQAGIKDIHVVTGGEHYPPLIKYLGSGRGWGVNISYSIQDEAGGIAQALGLAESFVGGEKMLVVLGDNLFTMNLLGMANSFKKGKKRSEAILFSRSSKTPERFGVIKYDGNDVVDIIEKPKEFISNTIITGIYMYTSDVFDIIKTLKPSGRGELEISDINRFYINRKLASIINLGGHWTDCGTFETLIKAEQIIGEVNYEEEFSIKRRNGDKGKKDRKNI